MTIELTNIWSFFSSKYQKSTDQAHLIYPPSIFYKATEKSRTRLVEMNLS